MILLLLLLTASLFAQEVLVLDIRGGVSRAMETNREIQRIKQEILSLESLYRAEKWDRFAPKMELLIDREGLGLFTRALLLDFGNRLSRIRSAEISVSIKRELLKEFERQVKIRLTELFAELYMAEKTAEVERERMAIAYVRFDRERERLARGLSDRVKVAEWERIYRGFRAKLLAAQRRYNRVLLEIKRFVGIPVDRPVRVDFSELLDFAVPRNRTVDADYLLANLKNNYLLRVKKLEVAYFRSRAKEQRRILYPELSAYLSAERSHGEDRFRGSWNLTLRVPLFDGRTSFYREKSLLDMARAVEIEREDIREVLRRKALEAPYRWEELMGRYESALAYDLWAQENLDLSRSNYELELAFDLGYAMSTKTDAERQLAEVRFEIILFLMRLYDLLGEDPLRVLSEEPPFLVEKAGEL